MRVVLAACLVAMATLTASAAGSTAKLWPGPYAFLERSGPDPLARIDPGTLRPVGRPLLVGAFNSSWSFSPDRLRLALGWSYTPTLGRPATVRIVDLLRWRVERSISLRGHLGQARAIAWGGGRLLVLLDRGRDSELIAVDTEDGLIVSARSVADSVVRVAVGAGRLALLTAPRDAVGPARLLLVDTALRTTVVRLDRITVGQVWDRGPTDEPRGRQRIAGLVVDPSWRTAYVLSADEAPAAVDLSTGSVTYGNVRALARVGKEAHGPWRFGLWAGRARVVFGGIDSVGREVSRVGVSLVDTATWTSRLLDASATTASVGDGVILTWDSWPGVDRTPGLRAFTTGGDVKWTALPGAAVGYVQVAGARALVRLSGTSATVVDLRTGETVGTMRSSFPELLLGRAAAW